MSARTCLIIAACFGFSGVLMGAFGAHKLAGNKDGGYLQSKYEQLPDKVVAGHKLPAAYKYLQDYKTAVRYHMWHALALLAIGLHLNSSPSKSGRVAARCFVAGIILFSGSLYLLVIAGPRFLGIPWGAVTPLGGTLLLAGWVSTAVAFAKSNPADESSSASNA